MLHMDIVCVGDCGIDRYLTPVSDSLGGCTLNVAMNIAALADRSLRVSVITALACDHESTKQISDVLVGAGVVLCASILQGALPIQKIQIATDGERLFKGYEPGVLADWKLNKIQTDMIASADLVVTLIFEQIEPLFTQIMAIQRRGKLSVDFMDMADFGKDLTKVEAYLDHCDFAFFGLSKDQDQILIDAIKLRYSRANHNKLAIVTLGLKGALVVGAGFCIEEPAVLVEKVVDTTGAGDSFAAVFLGIYLTGKSIPEAIRAAIQRASLVVQKKGAF